MATMLIDGQTVKAQAGKTLEVRNPANGAVVDTIPRGSAADVDAAVEAAAKALPAWASLSPTKRAALMHEAALKVRAAVPEIAKLLTQEQGKPLAHAVIEATRVAENLEFFAGFADKLRGDYVPLEDQNKFGLTLRRPVGVVAAITPWNFPLTLMANKVCPALAVGCTVVLKPASATPLTTQRTGELVNSVGDGMKEGVKMGPLHTERQRAEVEAQVADAVKRGAKVLAGGKRPEGKDFERGWFMEATVLTDVPEDSRMLTEEVFGPALPIVIVKDLDEAIAKSNASMYGLGSSIWTKDLAKARRAAEQLEAGYTWINDIQVAYDQLPFGGTKQSGFGKEHGIEGLDGYLEKKSVVLAY